MYLRELPCIGADRLWEHVHGPAIAIASLSLLLLTVGKHGIFKQDKWAQAAGSAEGTSAHADSVATLDVSPVSLCLGRCQRRDAPRHLAMLVLALMQRHGTQYATRRETASVLASDHASGLTS